MNLSRLFLVLSFSSINLIFLGEVHSATLGNALDFNAFPCLHILGITQSISF